MEERYSDLQLTLFYEKSGLFAKIIDAPAEAAAGADISLSLEGPEMATALKLLEDWLHWSETAEAAHHSVAAILEKAVQPVLKVHDLADSLVYVDGEEQIRRRLAIIDLVRGLFDILVLDAGDEFYCAEVIPEGIKQIIDAPERMLSAMTGIPEIILWGKPIDYERPGQMWRNHDEISIQSWYDLVEGIQSGTIKHNLYMLLSVIFRASVNRGELQAVPTINIQFSPVRIASAMDEADVKLAKAQKQLAQAKTAALYASMGVFHPTEIRRGLKQQRAREIRAKKRAMCARD